MTLHPSARNYPAAFAAWLQAEEEAIVQGESENLPIYETTEDVFGAFRGWLRGECDWHRRGKMTGHESIEHIRMMRHPMAALALELFAAEEACSNARSDEAMACRGFECRPRDPEARDWLEHCRATLDSAEAKLAELRTAIAA